MHLVEGFIFAMEGCGHQVIFIYCKLIREINVIFGVSSEPVWRNSANIIQLICCRVFGTTLESFKIW